jgi:4a-hydroxytetrahydrobiopterin dehydratase
MDLEYRKLSDDEIADLIAERPGWADEGGQIARTFEFPSYLEGIAFAAQVGGLAEALNHHPDILVTWRKVRVSVSTHDVKGLSPYDFELAARIDAMTS